MLGGLGSLAGRQGNRGRIERPAPVAGVGGLDLAFAILRLLAQASPEGARVTQIAQSVGLTQATVHRTLQALVAQDVVEQDARTRRYRLSVGFFVLAARAGNPMNEYRPKRSPPTTDSSR